MEIKQGMKFKGNVNGCEIKVVKADEKIVTYLESRSGSAFTIGRKMFEHMNITEIKE